MTKSSVKFTTFCEILKKNHGIGNRRIHHFAPANGSLECERILLFYKNRSCHLCSAKFTSLEHFCSNLYMLQITDDTAYSNTLLKIVCGMQQLVNRTMAWRLKIYLHKSQLTIFNHIISSNSRKSKILSSLTNTRLLEKLPIQIINYQYWPIIHCDQTILSELFESEIHSPFIYLVIFSVKSFYFDHHSPSILLWLSLHPFRFSMSGYP